MLEKNQEIGQMHVEIEVIEKQLADCKERASISDRALTSTQELQSAKME